MTAELDEIAKAINSALGQIMYEESDNKIKFPLGFKWRYRICHPNKGQQEMWYCWSITRNANNRYISWVYVWKGKHKHRVGEYKRIREHKRKNKAKARALRMLDNRISKR